MTKRKNPKDILPAGRPTDYRPKHNKQAMKLCLLGATDESLADFFEVSVTTLNTWKKKYPRFLSSIKSGKLVADANVAEALYKKALGYDHKDTHISNFQGEITITPIKKHYPPDTAAAFIWLKNRAAWKDKQEVSNTHSFENLEDSELDSRIREGLASLARSENDSK